MIIFKTTFHLDESVHDEALDFIKNTYTPKAMEGGALYMPQLSKLMVEYQEVGGSYVLQFRVKNIIVLNEWVASEGGGLEEDFHQKFGDKVCCFITLQKRIELQ